MSTDARRRLFFYQRCRLCLEYEGTCNVLETTDLVEDIFVCTSVKVTESDNLPHQICVKCSEVVKSWKELRLLATKNDVHLRTLFGGEHDSDCENDIIQLNRTTSATCVTPIKTEASPESNGIDNSLSSSKQKLCILLGEGEQNNETAPVIKQTISLRKDLFPPPILAGDAETEIESRTNKNNHHKLLKVKVEEENKRKRIKTDDGEEITYNCQECDKSFDKYKKLYLHLRLHNKKICCPLDACGKRFATKGDMEKHIRTHTGERPYRCAYCERSFSQRVGLRQHLRALHADSQASADTP